jgi:hypothetical protein
MIGASQETPMKAAVFAALAISAAVAGSASAQPPAPPKLATESPNYVSIPMQIDVKKPAAEVWKRIGKYCDIAEWLQIPAGCQITSGKDGEVGAVRTVGREILVGRTELSYSYTQPVYEGRPYNLYHGTLEARPLTPKTSRIVYTLMYDNSRVAGDDAAKAAEIQRRRTAFERGMANMKILAEGGTLPPPPAPAPPR